MPDQQTATHLNYEIAEAEDGIGWVVEAIDHNSEGECYVVRFTGPDAQNRAEEYRAWMSSRRAA